MNQSCLMDFQENDSFLKYDWESDWIKAIDLETEEDEPIKRGWD